MSKKKQKKQDFMIVYNKFQKFSNIAMAILGSPEDSEFNVCCKLYKTIRPSYGQVFL